MPEPGRQDALVRAWLRAAAAAIRADRARLTDLDAAIGDGDHGINLDRGFTALLADLDAGLPPGSDPAATLTAAGRRLLGVVGGASGALYGRGLMVAGERVRERAGAEATVTGLVGAILDGLIAGITGLGHAVPGDKTMVDALAPAAAILRHPPTSDPAAALLAVAGAADLGAQLTVPLVARKGRASYLGERSAGHEDPGAASAAILTRCLVDAALEAIRES
jgi:phosphoenolpyruvate---glycerone phosphotransferase subunit DhaL